MSKFTLIALSLTIYFLANIDVAGQIKTRTQIDSINAAYNGYWYYPNLHQFETQFPKLNNVPPLSSSMDYETILTYLYLDSIARNASTEFIYQNYLDRWIENSTRNDTTINAIKYLYKLIDYDPIRYHQYHYNIKKGYENTIYYINYLITKLFNSFLGYRGDYGGPTLLKYIAYDDIINADYILKIKVNSIDSVPKIRYPRKYGIVPNEYTYQVNATVLDTLKGKVFQNCYQAPMMIQPENIQTVISEICFTYGTGPYSNNILPFRLDPSLIIEGNLGLQEGQELVVFLTYGNYLWDYNFDYFQLGLFTVYPIINNEVKDISNIWSQDTSLPYQNWKLIFENKKNNILTGGY